MTETDPNTAFQTLGPDQLLDAVESAGYRCDGRFLALNSYENRVYQIGIEDAMPIVAKFYRPQRWSDEAILEEHAFTRQLAEEEIPVVAPLVDARGETLHHHGAFRFALYRRCGGRPPELDDANTLEQLGRFIGRIHAYGRTQPYQHRPTLNIEHYGVNSREFLLSGPFIPPGLKTAYSSLSADLISRIHDCYARAGTVEMIRLHGDCHPGNILWTDKGPHIVDFDDARMGPAVQDLWMFLSGDRPYQQARLMDILAGYTEFSDFHPRELHLIEALRTLRMMHYAAWIARRWDDPAFQRIFPWFDSHRYWDEHILALREQAAMMDEPPLVWD